MKHLLMIAFVAISLISCSSEGTQETLPADTTITTQPADSVQFQPDTDTTLVTDTTKGI